MYIEITSPTEGRVFVRADSIATVAVAAKGAPFMVTTVTGSTFAVTVEAEKNSLARLVGMRG